jgi:UPF0755 protein
MRVNIKIKIKIKKIPRFLIVLLIAITVTGILLVAITWITEWGLPPWRKPGEGLMEVVIPQGANAADIGKMLEETGVISSDKKFVFLAKIKGHEKRIKAGRYGFHKNMAINEVLNKLVKGEVRPVLVTIPEGLTIEEVADIIQKQVDIDKKRFIKLANDSGFVKRKDIEGKNFEGFLFPDTYKLEYGVTEKDIIERLVKEFWSIFNDSLKERSREIGFSIYQVVTLASLIEEEAMIEEEKPVISQVYHKRLKLNRALECDATIQYALTEHKSRLLFSDLKIKSPYNTYTHRGLPPGPICSPGETAILAALYPADTDFLYYVARGDGSHIFSKTAKEHNKAIRMLRNR